MGCGGASWRCLNIPVLVRHTKGSFAPGEPPLTSLSRSAAWKESSVAMARSPKRSIAEPCGTACERADCVYEVRFAGRVYVIDDTPDAASYMSVAAAPGQSKLLASYRPVGGRFFGTGHREFNGGPA